MLQWRELGPPGSRRKNETNEYHSAPLISQPPGRVSTNVVGRLFSFKAAKKRDVEHK
jgi:hypothetical protein